jgi:hypothetical protein
VIFIRDEAGKRNFSKINIYEFDSEIAKLLNVSAQTVTDARLGKTYKSYPGNIYKEDTKKAVVQLDAERALISRFDSIKEAAEKTDCIESCISLVCAGISFHHRGFIWMFEEEYLAKFKV